MVIGIAFAELHFLADRVYTTGANGLILADLLKAAQLFPYDHYYRLGPAQIIIRDNIWYTPEQALPILQETLKYDPYEPMIKAWIGVIEQRPLGIDRQGHTRALEDLEHK